MDDLDALLEPLTTDRLILLLTGVLRQSVRNADVDDPRVALYLARELIRRGHDPLPLLVSAMTLQVPE